MGTQPQTALRLKNALPVLLLFLCGALLRLMALNDPVTYDEAYTFVAFAGQTVWGILSDYSLPNNHIFHTLLVKLSLLLLGNDPWALRLPAFLAGVGGLILLYRLGRRFYDSSAALMALAWAAACPALIRYDSDARGYSLVAFFTLLAWLCADSWLGSASGRAAAGLTLSLVLGAFTLPTMLLPAGGIGLWLALELVSRRQTNRLPALFGLGLLTALLSLSLYLPALSVSGWRKLLANGFVQPVEAQAYFSGVLTQRLAETWQMWTMQVPAWLAWLIAVGVPLSLLPDVNRRHRWPLLLPMALWLALYVGLRRPQAYDRFWAFLLPLLLLWSAAGWTRAARWLETVFRFSGPRAERAVVPLRVETLLAVFIFGMTVLFSAAALSSFSSRWNKMGNPEAVALALQETLRPGDLVLAAYPVDAPLWYYLARLGHDETAWKADTFDRAFLIILQEQGQTLPGLLRSAGRDPARFDLENAVFQGRIGQLYTYLCFPK